MLREAKSHAKRLIVATAKRVLPRAQPPRKINIGAGRWYKPGWETVDFYQEAPWVDHRLDLRQQAPLPFADASVECAFTSHLVEHLDDETVRHLCREVHRVLRPGAVFRIATPDRDAAFVAYRRGDRAFFETGGVTTRGASIERRLVNYFASYRLGAYSGGPIVDEDEVARRVRVMDPEDFVSWCVSLIPSDAEYVAHVNGHSFEKLAGFLRAAGFTQVERSAYRTSRRRELRGALFDNRPVVSLYVEAFT